MCSSWSKFQAQGGFSYTFPSKETRDVCLNEHSGSRLSPRSPSIKARGAEERGCSFIFIRTLASSSDHHVGVTGKEKKLLFLCPASLHAAPALSLGKRGFWPMGCSLQKLNSRREDGEGWVKKEESLCDGISITGGRLKRGEIRETER